MHWNPKSGDIAREASPSTQSSSLNGNLKIISTDVLLNLTLLIPQNISHQKLTHPCKRSSVINQYVGGLDNGTSTTDMKFSTVAIHLLQGSDIGIKSDPSQVLEGLSLLKGATTSTGKTSLQFLSFSASQFPQRLATLGLGGRGVRLELQHTHPQKTNEMDYDRTHAEVLVRPE